MANQKSTKKTGDESEKKKKRLLFFLFGGSLLLLPLIIMLILTRPTSRNEVQSDNETSLDSKSAQQKNGNNLPSSSSTDLPENIASKIVPGVIKKNSQKKIAYRLQMEVLGSENLNKKNLVLISNKQKTLLKHPAHLKFTLINANGTSSNQPLNIKFNQSGFTKQKTPFTWEPPAGNNSISWYLTDQNSQPNRAISHFFYLDGTPPRLKFKIEGSPLTPNHTVSPGASLKLKAVDESENGIKKIIWRKKNENSWRTYREPLVLKNLMENNRVEIIASAIDKADNHSIPNNFTFTIDAVAPSIPDLFPGTAENSTLLIPPAGVVIPRLEADTKLYYRLDEGKYINIQTGQTLKIPPDSIHNLTLRASDAVGNSTEKRYKLKSDTTPPYTRILINGSHPPR